MESKINYTLVGIFVVLLLAGVVSFAFWLGKYGGKEEYSYYHVHMSESVAGLSTDSSVKYRGVSVGTVENIALNPDQSEQVQLLLKIKHNTPIRVDTRATLKSFGLTGLTYVELAGEGGDEIPLLTSPTGEVPDILASPSTFARIDESMGTLTTKVALALDKFSLLLSDQNLDNVSVTLSEIKVLAKKMGATELLVGTGNSSLSQLGLYQKCGFRMSYIKAGFFASYPEPIYENGIQCLDMVVLCAKL